MKTRMMRKIAVLVSGAALALSFPVASSVAQPSTGGGHSKACDNVGKSHGQGPKQLPQQSSNGKGWKCGFEKGQNGTNGNQNVTNGNQNGVNGNHGKACPGKGNPDHPSRNAPNQNGLKCGFHKGQNGDNLD